MMMMISPYLMSPTVSKKNGDMSVSGSMSEQYSMALWIHAIQLDDTHFHSVNVIPTMAYVPEFGNPIV